ncbi:MAG: restriction endonuclease subunit S, partial [Turicibacter sp.]|nr:restriction endonuclease subunit S [Turicibacter sp.]
MNKILDKNRQMKDSEVEWIGYIPENWNIVNIKFIFSSITEKNKFLQSQNVLSLVKDIGVIPYSEKGDIGNKCSEDITRYNLVRPNDIVMNSMNVIIGSVGKSKYIGVVSPVYYVLRVRDEQNSFVNYYENVFKTRMFQQSLKGYGNGILEHRMRIPIHNLNKVNIPLPHLNEQQAIANYLDEQVLKIDELIAEQKQAIQSWKAYKESLITEKVTKGLSQSIEMKESGIEWIGEIPK